MRRQLLGLLAIISCLAVAFPLPVEAEPGPRLARVTFISGATAGAIPVHLDSKAKIANPLMNEGSVVVTGGGDSFGGFALVAENVPDREGFVLLGGRLPKSAGSRHFIDIGGDWFTFFPGKSYSLRPGDYSLYLLPGDGRTTVKLTFDGLTGSTHLVPTETVSYASRSGEESTPITLGNYRTTTATSALDGKGLVFGATWFTAPTHAATEADVCFWRNEPRQPNSQLPNCGSGEVVEPGNLWGSSGSVDYGPSGEEVFKFYSSSWHPFSSGFDKPGLRYGVSTSITTAVPPDEIGSLGFWLSYR